MNPLPLNEAARLLEQAPYRFAKTMAATPHWYTLRERWDDAQFEEVVRCVQANGRGEVYRGRAYTSLWLNGFAYWTMGAPAAETILINRRRAFYQSEWDGLAARYDELISAQMLREREELRAVIGSVEGKTVYDVGCGTGLLLDLFPQTTPASYWGIDRSSDRLMVCAAKHPAFRSRLTWCTLEDFWPAEPADVVVELFDSGAAFTASDVERLPSLGREWHISTYDASITPPIPKALNVTSVQNDNARALSEMSTEVNRIGYHTIYSHRP